jgi:hypothetical protein
MDWLSNIFSMIKDWIPSGSKAITALYEFIASLSPTVQKLLNFLLMITLKVVVGNSIMTGLLSLINGIVLPTIGATADFSALAFVNYLFPFDTLCQFLIGYGVLRIACSAFRVTKSFVPGVS